MMFWNTKKNAMLAIDLGADAVRLVATTRRRGRPQFEFSAEQSLPDGPAATLPERQLAAIGDLMRTQHLGSSAVVAALPTSLVLTRTIRLDKAQGQTTEEQILWTLQNCLPFDPRDLLFDHWPVGEATLGKPQEVMVVATQASVVDKYLRGFESLKLRCVHLDVAPCALATLLLHTVHKPETPVCTLAISPSIGFFAVAEQGKVLFWRPFELAPAARAANSPGLNLQRVSDELMKCFSHMAAVMQLDRVSEMLVYGQASEDPQVGEFLHRQFHLPVRSPSPFEAILPENALAGAPPAGAAATHYCTAVGLALQNSGGYVHG